jgi:anti-sigma factor RsiW
MSGVVGRPGGDRDEEHRSWDELAVGWALHALEPEDETLFAAHLSGCQRCAHTVAETAEVMAAMASDLPPSEPSEGLRDRLRAAVEQTEQIPPAQPPTPPAQTPPVVPQPARPVPEPARTPLGGSSFGNLRAPLPAQGVDHRPPWRRVLPTALVAAGVAAVLSLGAWNVVVTGDRDAVQATAEAQSHMLDALLAPGHKAVAPLTEDGRTVATVVAGPDRVQVVANGLSVNDSHDHTYVVWGMQDGMPQPLGTFDVVTPQMDLRTVGSSATGLDGYAAYAVSLEPGREAPSYPTDVVAQGQVDS